jgi:hypothetical protein
MPKQVRLRRGTTAQHASFTGGDGELTVDTDKRALVLHDGVTAGGKVILPETRLLFSATANAVNNGTSAVSLFGTGQGSLTVPANFLKAGNVLVARFRGYLSTSATPGNLQLALLFPGALASMSQALPASLSLGFFMAEAHFRCAVAGSAGSGNASYWWTAAHHTTGAPVTFHGSDDVSLATDVAAGFNVTGTFSAAGQTLRIEEATLEVLR